MIERPATWFAHNWRCRALVEVRQLRCPVVTDAFRALAIEDTDDDPTAPLVWWDGLPAAHAFERLCPGQRANKIPPMDHVWLGMGSSRLACLECHPVARTAQC
jgi:hypothetical protein